MAFRTSAPLISAPLLLLFSSCVGATRPLALAAKQQAVTDLECPYEQTAIVGRYGAAGERIFDVRGCGRAARYSCREMPDDGEWRIDCDRQYFLRVPPVAGATREGPRPPAPPGSAPPAAMPPSPRPPG